MDNFFVFLVGLVMLWLAFKIRYLVEYLMKRYASHPAVDWACKKLMNVTLMSAIIGGLLMGHSWQGFISKLTEFLEVPC